MWLNYFNLSKAKVNMCLKKNVLSKQPDLSFKNCYMPASLSANHSRVIANTPFRQQVLNFIKALAIHESKVHR